MAACLLALPVGAAFAQTGTIASRVTDAVTGETLPGVNVVLEGAVQGGATDAQERYAITGVAPGAYTLVASFVGYGDQHEAGVEVTAGDTTTVDIAMQQQAQGLDEVVVGYAELQSNTSLGSTFIYLFAPHNSGAEITGDNASPPTGLNIPTRDMLDAYEAGDERKEASVGLYIDPANRQHGIAMGDTIPYVKKYDSPHAVRGVTGDNWPVYRYAEILLMMTEALNEMGETGEAYEYINPVRRRAGLDALPAGLSQSQFRDAVYHEQRVELAFENDRWFTLLRTGRALEEMKRHAAVHRGIQTHWQEPAYNIEPHKLQYPLPQRELTLSPDLEQNSGW